MKIELKKNPTFCLTCENNDGFNYKLMQEEFGFMNNGLGPEFVNPIITQNGEKIPKNKSGASGFIRMIERGLMKQIPGEPFIPFILLEDDVSMNDEPYKENDIIYAPDNTDILYIGISGFSFHVDTCVFISYYKSVDDYPNIMRIRNMLSSHGIIICSALGAAALQRTMMETWFSEKDWDIPMAYIQSYYNIYALRKPFVYQKYEKGGKQSDTEIILRGEGNTLPIEYINCDLATIFVPDKRLI
jgi:hypothetical protein